MENDGEPGKGNRVSLKRKRMDFEDDGSTEDDIGTDEFDDSEEEEWWEEDESSDDSEEMDHEQDIEEHEYTASSDPARTLKIRLFLTDGQVGGSKWMKSFVVKCTCDGVAVASALARYIDREGMRSKFWERMEEPSEETCDVAFHIFDRYGTVKTKYKDHPVQRGTGIWGKELDHGPLFLIEKVHVTAMELRRKGLGQRVVSLLLEKAKRFWLDDKPDGDKSAEERLMTRVRVQSGAIDFWRSCGFRRIGASRCFAYSFDLQHQSRTLAVTSDFDPRTSHAEDLEDEELEVIYEAAPSTEVKRLKMDRLRDSLPLHHAALTLMDEELKAFFVFHASDELGWERVTNSEATLLHLTASELKPLSTRWLLENVHHANSWKTARDLNGYTPLGALQEKLETMRTQKPYGLFRILNVSDHFKGA
ncbi:hypothetical protein AtubIFM57258_005215 [Aspergillus tubingensis]|nr:hypothetical protein AtubIFM57258_005215 [Aspergillus tubingensis]